MKHIPNEIYLHIISYFDIEPPSVTKFHHEPSIDLTCSPSTSLKNLSRVSWHWRKIVLPLLFRFLRVRLDDNPHTVVMDAIPSGNFSSQDSIVSPHEIDMYTQTKDQLVSMEHAKVAERNVDGYVRMSLMRVGELDLWLKQFPSTGWLPHAPLDFDSLLEFMQKFDLKKHVRSLVVYTDKESPEPSVSPLIYQAVANLWDRIFASLDPSRIVIAAPPSTMNSLTIGWGRFDDAEAFGMKMHYVAFSIDDDAYNKQHARMGGDNSRTTSSRGVLPDQKRIMYRKSWTHLSLNQGSSVPVYSTYEYHHRTTPQIWEVLLIYFQDYNVICSFSFTGIFPLQADVAGITDNLYRFSELRELRFQLAPGPESDLLSVPGKLGRAQTSDLWLEWDEGYKAITSFLSYALSRTSCEGAKFVSGDIGQARMAMDIERHMNTLQERGVGWRNDGEGVWIRDSSLDRRAELDVP